MTRSHTISHTGINVGFALLLTSCGSDPGFNESVDFARKDGAVQFVNMIPDSPELTAIHGLNNTLVPYGFASPVSVRFEDNYDWRVAYLGTNNEEVTLDQDVNQPIREDVLSTFLFFGTTGQADIQVVDHTILPVADRPEGQTELWFAVNTTVAMVDIYLTEFDIPLTDSEPLVTLGTGSVSELILLGAGPSKQLRVTEASTQSILFDSGSIELPAQSQELFGIIDDFGPDNRNHVDVIRAITFTGGTLIDVSQGTKLRSVNLSTATPIDVVVGGTTFANLARGLKTNYLNADAGVQSLTITSENITLLDENITIGSNAFLSLQAFDAATEQTADTLLITDRLRLVVDRSTFQFVNGSQQAVDMFLLRNGSTIGDTLASLNDVLFSTSGVLEVRPGQVQFVITNADQSQTLASIDVTLTESQTYTLVFDTEDVLHLFEDQPLP